MRSSNLSRRTTDADRLDATFHALADRTRRALLARLSVGPAMVSELAAPFGMTRVAVSKHVRVLERARLVRRAVDGRVHRCALNAGPLREADRWLARYRSFWTETLQALARYVDRDQSRKR